MITAILIVLAVYTFSIFLCRYSFRMQYVWGHWLKKDCGVNILWFIPIVNTMAGTIFLNIGYLEKERTYKHKFTNWFTNKDL